MQKKISKVFFFLIISVLSCNHRDTSTFFAEMQKKYNDLSYGHDEFYIKGFGLSKDSTLIANKYYRKLDCEYQSLFFLRGFIRWDKGNVYLLPLDFQTSDTIVERKLFDFVSDTDNTRNVILSYQNPCYCLEVQYLYAKRAYGEQCCVYKLIPYIQYKNEKKNLEYEHIVEVTPKKGVTRIITTQQKLKDTIADCVLYPSVQFKYRGWRVRPI